MRARNLLAAVLMAAGARASAQDFTPRPRVQPELRLDATAARTSSLVAMAGANVPLGVYVRLGLAGGGGAWSHGSASGAAARADLTVRYLLDPFGEYARGFYAGGGLTVRADDERRAGLLLLFGMEGRARRGYRMAAEVGLGEGVRMGFVLRRARANSR
ncbi:MAG: hypothetical protein ACYC3L_06300 [Gemmatimonadaceae bacterium]